MTTHIDTSMHFQKNAIVFIFDERVVGSVIRTIKSILEQSSKCYDMFLITGYKSFLMVNDKFEKSCYQFRFVDIKMCYMLQNIQPSSDIHIAARCKILIPDLIPHEFNRLLFIDNDVLAVRTLDGIWDQIDSTKTFGMAVDMGDVCLLSPSECWNAPLCGRIPTGLICGELPKYMLKYGNDVLKKHQQIGEVHCPNAGDTSDYYLNGGIILFNVEQCIQRNFVRKMLSIIKFYNKNAKFADQDWLNAYAYVYREEISLLDCGYNYQARGVLRSILCNPSQNMVFMIHLWGSSIDPNNVFYKKWIGDGDGSAPIETFDHNINIHVQLKLTETRTPIPYQNIKYYNMDREVYVITRHTGHITRLNTLQENIRSVFEQGYSRMHHIVVTETVVDLSMFNYTKYVKQLNSGTLPVHAYNKCPACLGDEIEFPQCMSAPSVQNRFLRENFFRCFCSTPYPANLMNNFALTYIKNLSAIVFYLDDDMRFASPHAIRSALSVYDTDYLGIFTTARARMVPMMKNLKEGRVEYGDVDTNGLVHDNKHSHLMKWENLRCGDAHSALNAAQYITPLFSQHVTTTLCGIQPKSGSLGLNLPPRFMHVILMTYDNKRGNKRHAVTCHQVRQLLYDANYSRYVHRVHLVWNSGDSLPPCRHIHDYRFITHEFSINTLMNRWYVMNELSSVDESANFIFMDDDIFLKYNTFEAMIQTLLGLSYKQPQHVGIFVRRFIISDTNLKYSFDEMFINNATFHHVLPRIMAINNKAAREVTAFMLNNQQIKQIVDETTTEDIASSLIMNILGGKLTRLIPCTDSIIDYYSNCTLIYDSGMAGQPKWAGVRNRSLNNLWIELGSPALHSFSTTIPARSCKSSFEYFNSYVDCNL